MFSRASCRRCGLSAVLISVFLHNLARKRLMRRTKFDHHHRRSTEDPDSSQSRRKRARPRLTQ